MNDADPSAGSGRRDLFYGAVTLFVAGSFLAEILRVASRYPRSPG